MKGKTVFKILLDIAMTVLYALLVFDTGAGPFFHETAGLGIGVMFILHVFLNLDMMRALGKSVRSGKAGAAKKLLFYSDVFLPFGMFFSILTGVLISNVLFGFGTSAPIFALHKASSYICLAILFGHIALHGKYIVGVVKNAFANWKSAQVVKSVSGFAALALIIYVAYSSFYSGYKESAARLPAAYAASDTVYGGANLTSASESSDEEKASITPPPETEEPTLNQFLGKMFCTGCHRHCPLTSPRCGTGEAQAENAKESYEQQYGTHE